MAPSKGIYRAHVHSVSVPHDAANFDKCRYFVTTIGTIAKEQKSPARLTISDFDLDLTELRDDTVPIFDGLYDQN